MKRISPPDLPIHLYHQRHIIPPTPEMVREYCCFCGYMIDEEEFINYYQSIGWESRRTKMSDWQSAIRTWEYQNEKLSKTKLKKTGR